MAEEKPNPTAPRDVEHRIADVGKLFQISRPDGQYVVCACTGDADGQGGGTKIPAHLYVSDHLGLRPAEQSNRATAAAAIVDELLVLAEAATGYKARLEAMGWSPTAAEQLAANVLAQQNQTALALAGRRQWKSEA